MARKKLLSEGEVRQFMKLANLGGLSEKYFTHNSLNEEGGEEFGEFALEDEDEVLDLGDEEVEDVEDVEVEEEGELISLDDFMSALEQAVEEVTGQPVETSVEGGDEEEDVDLDVAGPGLDVDIEDEDPLGAGTNLYEAGERAAQDPNRIGSARAGGRCTMDEGGDGTYEEVEGSLVCVATGQTGVGLGGHQQRKRARAGERTIPAGNQPGGAGPPTSWAGLREMEKGFDPDAIVAEVARRVASRLQADHQKKEISEQLAERIFSRLTAK